MAPKRTWWQSLKGSFGSQQGASGGMVFVDRAATHVARGSREIVDMYHQSPWLRATVTKIGQRVGSTCWRLYRVQPSTPDSKALARKIRKDLRTISKASRNAYIRRAVQQQEVVEVTDHLLLTLWERGNACFPGTKIRELTQKYVDTIGECAWVIERNAQGLPVEVWPIPPTWITKLPEKAHEPVEIHWGQTKRKVAQSDVIWFRDESLKNPYGRGIGIAHSLSDELDSDEYASQLIKTAFENRGLLDVVISVEGARKEQLDQAKAEFENRHRGWLKAGVPFFHSGKADVKVVSQSFSEMQLLQLREWERDTIISIYGVPPELLGVLGKSNRATILESREIMASEVLIPRLEAMRSVVNNSLVCEFGEDLILDYDDPTPSNDDFKLRAMQANPASVTVREWREIQGLEDRGEHDEYVFVPVGLVPYRGTVAPQDSVEDSDAEVSGAEASSETKAWEPVVLDSDGITKANDPRITNALNAISGEAFVKRLVPVWERRMRKAAEAQLKEIEQLARESGKAVTEEVTKSVISDIYGIVGNYIRAFSGTLITGDISQTTLNQIRATLQEGVDLGEDTKTLGARVAEVFDFNRTRGVVIARTEVNRAQNYATYAAQEASNLVSRREWVSTYDERTRDSHVVMNGQIVDMNKPFVMPDGTINAGATALHPGDFMIAEEDINCRCTVAPVIDDVPDDFDDEFATTDITTKAARRIADTKAYWDKYDEALLAWEGQAIPLILEAFDEQKRAVLAAIGA